ncbi:MAG TPA: hypothetical protein VFA16_02785 [Mycobacterium sp.]|uniref:hypothetical protein n=1 Tax=Mycobacterium sp. TaxID=1785 RepID=UPI002D71A2F0|nr:hypothetical protein [Mycobacterium sp.]HZU46176.1 hypothetical protein [Mycobacterium sp.]
MSNPVYVERSRRALAVRHYGADSPEARDAKRDLIYAKTTAYIKQLVSQAPPFTPEQLDQLRVLLEPARRDLAELEAGGDDA